MQMREKVGKTRNTVFFHYFEAPDGRKVGSLKRQLARWEMKIFTPLEVKRGKTHHSRNPFGSWDVGKGARRCGAKKHIWKSKISKNTPLSDHFGSWDVEKEHAVMAQSTFGSKKWHNTSVPDHFWKLRCRQSASRCGTKHIWKWNVLKPVSLGTLLEVEMSKKCTPLWNEAHLKVKILKTPGVRTTFGRFDGQPMSKKCTPLWREAHLEVKCVKNCGF